MNDDRNRASWEMTSPRGPMQPTAVNPYGFSFAEETEPEIDIMEYVRLVWAKKWLVLGVLLSVVVFATAWSLTRPKLYRASTKITLSAPPQLSNNQLDSMMNWWQMDRIIADQVQILKTRALAQRVVDRLGLDSYPAFAGGDATSAILNSIDAEPIEETFVVEVTMTGRDQMAIAEWLNIYIEEYTAANIEDSLERTRLVYDVIQSRLDPLREKVSESEQLLMNFREREDAVLLADQDKNVISEQVSTLTTEYAETKTERIRLETKLNALRNMKAFNISRTSFPEVLKDDAVKNLIEQRNEYQGQLTEKLRSLKEGHPEVQDLRSRISSLDEQIVNEVETIKMSLQTDFDIVSGRERSLYNNIQSLRTQTIDLSKQTLELERLQRDYNQNKAFLEEMLARSNEADIASTKGLNNVRVIERARPPGGAFRPNPPRAIALGTVVGLFLGIGLVVGLDFLDHTLRSPDHMERYVGLETLTVLPKMTKENERVLREAFQSLRTAVMLAARGDDSHVVMVTSAVPNEGKTTTAYNLAKSLANGGARVLLIDADLRKPRLHRMIDAKNVRGLTSVVLGERTAAEVIHRVPNLPNLDLITSGPLPPNPPELFGKKSFNQLLDEARKEYDWVLIDTPPVAMVTDPVICAGSAELVLLVVQYGSTKREIVRETVRLLGRTGAHLAGAILNKVEVDRDPYYYGGYYSYARYGYYGDGPITEPDATPATTKPADKAG
ncbi:MAG: polysaccharide biosynthesis tyrosine autokinase [Acidobacteriota bacterium]|nr:polysaccharide biosynthesis tyrosine autokinase [Acidobacteriota bacterium]